jgi:hypothetical protein
MTTRLTFAGFGCLAAMMVSSAALADNFYACPTPDGDIVYTNFKKSRNCRLEMKGISGKPAKSSGKKYSGNRLPGAPAPIKDWSIYAPIIKEAARIYELPEYLIKAVIQAESALDPYAVSSAGAEGLMQLMPGTASDMKVSNSFDPRENIMGGAKYLRLLANTFDGDMILMLAGYNAGHNRVMKNGNRVPPISETQAYVRIVYNYYMKFKKEYMEEQEKLKQRTVNPPAGESGQTGVAARAGSSG